MRTIRIALILVFLGAFQLKGVGSGGYPMADGVFVEFQLVSGSVVERDVLRVSVVDTQVVVQGSVKLSRTISRDVGAKLIQLGRDRWPSDKSVVEDYGEFSIAVDVRHGGSETKLLVLQKTARKTSDVERVLDYLAQVEIAIGADQGELVRAAEKILASEKSARKKIEP